MKRKFLASFALLFLLTMFPTQAFAGNNEDSSFTFQSSYVAIHHTLERAKTDTTPVYVYIQRAPGYNSFVKAQGRVSGGSWFLGNEGGAQAALRTGTKYSLHTLIYENGWTRARLEIMATGRGETYGVWSPDSVGSYTDAW